MDEMKKLIEVTIVLGKNGAVDYEFYEPESGDFTRVSTTLQESGEIEKKIGEELLSWLTLMADEMEEQDG